MDCEVGLTREHHPLELRSTAEGSPASLAENVCSSMCITSFG